jgi:CRISPR-associated protein Csm4
VETSTVNLYRVRLRPTSPWRTPWQSDTLAGMLCCAAARRDGADVLAREILQPAMSGRPSFVLSDAFPGDWLPIPMTVRLQPWPAEERKPVKRARWLTPDAFRHAQRGELLAASEFVSEPGFHSFVQLRNTIGRTSNTTSDGGGLFGDRLYAVNGNTELSVYVRVADGFADRLLSLFRELEQTGFGSDNSIGKGQFELVSELQPQPELDSVPNANGVVVLSSFQPGPTDPTEGYWESFTKYGKLGSHFGIENVFKRPMIMLRPGACFRMPSPRAWIGRAIAMDALLALDTAATLSGQGCSVFQLAFGLTMPFVWSK